MNIEQQRADFEAWMRKEHPDYPLEFSHGVYYYSPQQRMFEAYQAGRAALQSQDREDAEFELVQDDAPVAGTSGKREYAWAEIQRYAAQYSEDGPIEIWEITRRRIEGEGK